MTKKAVILASCQDSQWRRQLESSFPDPGDFSRCLTCGACASGCPVSGKFQMDPRKFVRMTVLGLVDDPAVKQWAAACTLCGECTRTCPMGIDIPSLVTAVREIWHIRVPANEAATDR